MASLRHDLQTAGVSVALKFWCPAVLASHQDAGRIAAIQVDRSHGLPSARNIVDVVSIGAD